MCRFFDKVPTKEIVEKHKYRQLKDGEIPANFWHGKDVDPPVVKKDLAPTVPPSPGLT